MAFPRCECEEQGPLFITLSEGATKEKDATSKGKGIRHDFARKFDGSY